MKRAHLIGVTSVTEKNGKWSIFYFDDTPVTYGGKLTISLPVFGDMTRKRLPYRFSMRAGKMIHQIKNGIVAEQILDDRVEMQNI